MIIKEFYKERKDGIKLYRTYSDKKLIIQQEQTNMKYNEAIDVENTNYTYVETDIPIEEKEISDSEKS